VATTHRHRRKLAPPPIGQTRRPHHSRRNPRRPHTPFLWLPRLLLQHMATAGNTPDEIGK